MSATRTAAHLKQAARLLVVSIAVLGGAAAAQSINDAGIRAARARSDYAAGIGTSARPLSLAYTQAGPEGCLFAASDSFAACPGRAGLPNLPNGNPVWFGGLETREACGDSTTRIGDSWVGCVSYAASPYFSVNSPGSQYWVIVANNEPSFDHCNIGPPGLSNPIASIGASPAPLFGFDVLQTSGDPQKRLQLTLALSNKNFFCTDVNAYVYSIPFVSVGAQNGHGNAGPVGYISTHGSPRGTIVFDAGISSYQALGCRNGTQSICNASTLGVHAGIWGSATWGGVPHIIFLDFYGEGVQNYEMYAPGESKWNWPIQDSFFYPGAELITFVAGTQLATYCGIDLPRYTTDFTKRRYRIDFGELLACADRLGLFSQSPPNGDIALDGMHWYIEGVATLGQLGNEISHAETAIFVQGFD